MYTACVTQGHTRAGLGVAQWDVSSKLRPKLCFQAIVQFLAYLAQLLGPHHVVLWRAVISHWPGRRECSSSAAEPETLNERWLDEYQRGNTTVPFPIGSHYFMQLTAAPHPAPQCIIGARDRQSTAAATVSSHRYLDQVLCSPHRDNYPPHPARLPTERGE